PFALLLNLVPLSREHGPTAECHERPPNVYVSAGPSTSRVNLQPLPRRTKRPKRNDPTRSSTAGTRHCAGDGVAWASTRRPLMLCQRPKPITETISPID